MDYLLNDYMEYHEAMDYAQKMANRFKRTHFVIHYSGRKWIVRERVHVTWVKRGRHTVQIDPQ